MGTWSKMTPEQKKQRAARRKARNAAAGVNSWTKLTPEQRARYIARREAKRKETCDPDVPSRGAAREARTDLGLALLAAFAEPGASFTNEEIAAWCGCTDSAIQQIIERALRKLRNRLLFSTGGLALDLAGALQALGTARTPARRTPRRVL